MVEPVPSLSAVEKEIADLDRRIKIAGQAWDKIQTLCNSRNKKATTMASKDHYTIERCKKLSRLETEKGSIALVSQMIQEQIATIEKSAAKLQTAYEEKDLASLLKENKSAELRKLKAFRQVAQKKLAVIQTPIPQQKLKEVFTKLEVWKNTIKDTYASRAELVENQISIHEQKVQLSQQLEEAKTKLEKFAQQEVEYMTKQTKETKEDQEAALERQKIQYQIELKTQVKDIEKKLTELTEQSVPIADIVDQDTVNKIEYDIFFHHAELEVLKLMGSSEVQQQENQLEILQEDLQNQRDKVRRMSAKPTARQERVNLQRTTVDGLKGLQKQLARSQQEAVEAEQQRKATEAKFRYIFSTGPYQKCFIVLAVIIGAIGFDYIMMHRLANSTDTTQSNNKKQKTDANKKQMSAKERSKLRRRHYLIGGCLGWISSYIIVVLYNAYEYQQKSQSAAIPTTVGSPLS